MATRTNRGERHKKASDQRSRERSAGEEVVGRAITLANLDRRLSSLTWSEIGLLVEGPTAIDAGRRRNRFAALGPEIAAGRNALSRPTRVRALTYLGQEVRGLRAKLAVNGRLTGTELARVGRAFGGPAGPLRDHLHGLAGRSDRAWAALDDALATEEAWLAQMLKVVQRVPDPVPPLKPGHMRWLSIRHLLRLWAAARHELRETTLVFTLAADYETKPRPP
jgi:hypothetical protein